MSASDLEVLEEQQEGVPNDLPRELWRKVKKNKTSIAVYTISVGISVGVILTQQKIINHMNQEKQKMSENIQSLEQKMEIQMQKQEEIQLSMTQNLEKLEQIESNTTDNNNNNAASNGFWSGFAGTTMALATRVIVGAVFGV